MKDAKFLDEANRLFKHMGMKITLTGERHLGAVIGSQENRDKYVKEKVDKCIAYTHLTSHTHHEHITLRHIFDTTIPLHCALI